MKYINFLQKSKFFSKKNIKAQKSCKKSFFYYNQRDSKYFLFILYMEFFFLVPWVHTEIIIFCIVTVIFIGALIWYYFPTFVRIFQKFGPKGRDARIDGRDSELLKEREKTEEQKFQEQIQSLENPILSGDETDTKLLLEEKEP